MTGQMYTCAGILPFLMTLTLHLVILSLALQQGLAKLLADSAPQSFKETKFDNYFGRRIAVDASMHIYQFLVQLLCHTYLLPCFFQ